MKILEEIGGLRLSNMDASLAVVKNNVNGECYLITKGYNSIHTLKIANCTIPDEKADSVANIIESLK